MTEFFSDCCPLWKSLLWPSLHYESLSPPQRKTLGVCCPHVISSSWPFRLVLTGCCFLCVYCQYWETVEQSWCLHWLKGDLVLMTRGGSISKTNLVLVLKQEDCVLWRTLHNQRHTDTSKRTTWLPHDRFDRTNIPHFQSFTNIKPYAYLRVKRGRTFYWLNYFVCSLS